MPIGLRYLIILIIGIFSCGVSYAQLSADFTATPQQGCSPLVVSFTDQSTGGTITYREWIFGNGNTSIGNNQSPTATYVNGGLYSVTLLVANATDTSTITKTNFITVFDNPIPDFSFSPTSGCVPTTVNFTNNSTVPLIGINQFTWDFGDGSPTVNSFSPSHNYQTAGNFTVSLSIVDANGCTANKDSIGIINIANKPIADFNATGPTQSCAPPLTVNFNNLTTGNNLQYNWFFQGGGGSSTATNPSITYTQNGQFYVRLIAVNPAGCADTAFKANFVSIVPTVADFSLPDTICFGDSIPIQNLSVGASQFNWDFGNFVTSTKQNPKAFYATPGNYVISLTATSPPNCTDTKLDTVYVEAVNANFTVDSGFACSVPFTATYQDLSTGNIVKWDWLFDDQDPLTPPQKGGGQNPQRVFFSDVITNDKLVVTTAAGCKDSISIPNLVQVAQPQVSFSVDVVTGCAPLKVNFSNTTTSVDSISSFIWSFDSLGTSVLPSDSFTFQFPGTFNACLKATTSLGCIDSICIPIKAGDAPTIDFIQEKDSTCAGNAVQFTDKSTDSTKVDFWSWNFGDNTPPETSKGPRHRFNDVGWIPLEYVVGIGGCFDTVFVDSVIFVNGPIAEVLQSPYDCKNPLNIDLSAIITAGNRFKWDFGDSLGYDSTNLNTNYNYLSSGDYKVIFTAYNDSNGCEYAQEINVQPRQIQAKFTITDSLACAGEDVNFDGLISIDEKALSYRWEIGNGNSYPFTPKPPVQQFNNGGTYLNRLIVEDVNGCKDTLIKPIQIFEVDPNFLVNTNFGCAPLAVNFTEQIAADTAINKYVWSFGNGDSSFVANPNYSFSVADSLQNLTGNTVSDTFFVNLFAVDTLGCSGSFKDTIIAYRYLSKFGISTRSVCIGEPIDFEDSLQLANLTYTWFFGNGDSAIGTPINYAYATSGIFEPYVKRTESGGGCVNIDSLPTIEVQGTTTPLFYANITDTNCFPAQILFIDTTPDTNIVLRTWQFRQGGNIISIANDSASTTYNQPGVFDVKLKTTTSNGCQDSTTLNNYIDVGGPFGQLVIEPDTACKNDEITFSIKNSQNVASIFFDFGDGNDTTLFNPDTMAAHQYRQIGNITNAVILNNQQGNCPKTSVGSLYIYEVTGGIRFLTDSSSCAPFSGRFLDISKGNDQMNFYLNSVPWFYNSDSLLLIDNPGLYRLTQIVSDSATGCIDTVNRVVEVFENPTITGIKDTTICKGDTLQVFLSGASKYKWTPNLFIEGDSLANNRLFPVNQQAYQILGVDSNNCSTSVAFVVAVQQDFSFNFYEDTTIYQGEIVPLTGLADNLVNYSWSPLTGLDCADCPFPLAQPLSTTTYNLNLVDFFGCFPKDSSVTIEVIQAFSVDLPNTFTPNGDGVNDVIYAKGWGIESILEFKIFNRWGEIVFETTDINQGWDGTYKGKPQEMDAYAYLIRVEGYNGEEIAKKGFINLTR